MMMTAGQLLDLLTWQLHYSRHTFRNSDVQLDRLAQESTSPAVVAEEIIRELKLQLPPQQAGQS